MPETLLFQPPLPLLVTRTHILTVQNLA